MPQFSVVRSALGKICFGLGSVWIAAGVLKLVFGIRIIFPLFPPLDLDRVAAGPSITVGLLLVFVGAWLERRRVSEHHDSPAVAANELGPFLETPPLDSQASIAQKLASRIYRSR
jgi:hypothetical protein